MKSTPSRSIRFRVVALAAIIIVPLIIALVWVAMNQAGMTRTLIELQRKDLSHELSRAIDRDFVELKGTLIGIANTFESDKFDQSMSYTPLVNSSRFGKILALWSFAPDGSTIKELGYLSANSTGHKLPKELVSQVVGGGAGVSSVVGEGMANANVVIAVPVYDQNNIIVSGLAAEVSVSFFDHAFKDVGMKMNWVAAVVDRNGRFVARSVDAVKRVGTAARPELAVVAQGNQTSGTFENVTLEGTPVLNSFERSLLTDWTTVMAVPKSELAAPLQLALTYSVLGGLAALALSILAAIIMAARISVPVTNLSQYAAALAEGETVVEEQYHITEIENVRNSLNEVMAKSARLATIVSSSGDAIIQVDGQGNIENWNKGAETIFGYASDEIIGKPKSILVPKALISEFESQRPKVLAGEVVRSESLRLTKSGQKIDVEFVDAPIIGPYGENIGYSTMIKDISERRAASDHRQFLMQELAHRTKNQLAIIQSIAQQTKRSASTLDDFISAFNDRLQGLAASHNILAKQQWKEIPLRELVRSQIGVLLVDIDKSVDISGPEIVLNAVQAESLGLSLHELTTNSLKHGALSVVGGRISVSWNSLDKTDTPKVVFEWEESGGPEIKKAPSRQGFGSKVLNTLTAVSLGGDAQTEFRPRGLYWRLTWQLKA